MNRIKGTVLALAMSVAALPALAGDARLGDIEIKAAWARATPPRPPVGGAYLTIVNAGAATDNLVGASSPACQSAELHTHMSQGDTMRMIALSSVEIPAGRTIEFAPGGMHVMLMGLKAPLKEGTTIPLTLEFTQAGKITVQVDVAAVGAAVGAAAPAAAPMMHDPAMHQQHMQDPEHRKMHDAMHPAGK
jgi:copper(I)-binding protein